MERTGTRLILLLPAGGRVDRQLTGDAQLAARGIVRRPVEPDERGRIEPPDPGRIVAGFPSPEALVRERAEVRAAVAAAGRGSEPLVITLEAASELRDEELDAALQAAGRAERPVILAILGDG
jgi:hypothetical protein